MTHRGHWGLTPATAPRPAPRLRVGLCRKRTQHALLPRTVLLAVAGPWEEPPHSRKGGPPKGSRGVCGALPFLSGGLKKSAEKNTEDSNSFGNSSRTSSNRGTLAPVKLNVSKMSTARTVGTGHPCHPSPTPATDSSLDRHPFQTAEPRPRPMIFQTEPTGSFPRSLNPPRVTQREGCT